MSLRTELREAFDEVTPPAPTLEWRVQAYVEAATRKRRVSRPRRWTRSLRGSLALVAVLVVVVLMAGLVLGGRIWRDLHSSPTPLHHINQTEVKRLEARPLLALPALGSEECQTGPLILSPYGSLWAGDGSMHGFYYTTVYNTTWGRWNQTEFAVDPSSSGLFLIRARDVISGQPVVFALNLSGVSYVGGPSQAVLTGQILGGDVVNGLRVQPHTELVIDASGPSQKAKGGRDWPTWEVYVGNPNGASGCVAFQVDHGDSTETFVIKY